MLFRGPYWLAATSVLLTGFGLTGCARTPDSYPAPEQHLPFRAHGTPVTEFVTMEHPELSKAVVKDIITGEPGPWKWTGADPELRFTLTDTIDRTLRLDFVVHDESFRKTGPLTLSFYVNDRPLGKERYESEGHKTFEKAVPAEWLKPRQEIRVRAHIDNALRTPDGTILGVLLKRAGFVE